MPVGHRTHEPFLRLPGAVTALLLALIGAHAARALASQRLSDIVLRDYAFWPWHYDRAYLAAFHVNPPNVLDQAIPFVSYLFLHANWEHLAVNCIWLLPFGAIVARRFGAVPFLLFFLVCGIGGAVVHLAFNWGSMAPVVGASAAVAGLMAAAFRMMGMPPGALAPLLSPRILLWSGVWTLINIVAGMTGLGAGSEVRLIAWQAHLGGYFSGLFLAGPFQALSVLLGRR